MTLIVYTDGGARGNPGPAGAGVVAYDGEKKIFELGKFLGDNLTNNWAEYEALILALTEAKKLGFAGEGLEVRMDSELIVRQMTGEYKVKDKNLKLQHAKVRELQSGFSNVRFTHVPREENKEADRLVNEAIDDVINAR